MKVVCYFCSDPVSASLVSWLNSLPHLLKKLGSTSLETSSLILEVLGHAAAKNILSTLEQLFSKLVIIL